MAGNVCESDAIANASVRRSRALKAFKVQLAQFKRTNEERAKTRSKKEEEVNSIGKMKTPAYPSLSFSVTAAIELAHDNTFRGRGGILLSVLLVVDGRKASRAAVRSCGGGSGSSCKHGACRVSGALRCAVRPVLRSDRCTVLRCRVVWASAPRRRVCRRLA
eukprot:6206355-Pleurochrysis_carterae.AAC.2